MVNRNVSVNIELEPDEIESEIWEADAAEQVDLIIAMVRRYRMHCSDVLMQMQGISDEMDILPSNERKEIVRFFEDLLEYIKGDEK